MSEVGDCPIGTGFGSLFLLYFLRQWFVCFWQNCVESLRAWAQFGMPSILLAIMAAIGGGFRNVMVTSCMILDTYGCFVDNSGYLSSIQDSL